MFEEKGRTFLSFLKTEHWGVHQFLFVFIGFLLFLDCFFRLGDVYQELRIDVRR